MQDPRSEHTRMSAIPPTSGGRPGELRFLCERCGYPLDGLPNSGFCPECGQSARISHPDRRTGSAWQRRPAPGSWLRTVVAALLRPRELLGLVQIERRRSLALAWASCAAAAVLAVVGLGLPLGLAAAGLLFPEGAPSVAGWAWGSAGAAALGTLILMGLTWIEARGIRFFGARHGFRITPDVAWAVCGHAAAGWVLGSAAGTLGAWAGVGGYWLGLPGWAVPVFPVLGIAAGFLFFEWFAWLGMRRCRYANPPGAGRADSADPDAAGPA